MGRSYKKDFPLITSSSRRGQSLAELLIGMALGAVFIIGAATLIAPSLQTVQNVSQIQTESTLANELLGNVKAWAAGNWNNVLSIATGTTNVYYINASTSPFVASGTTQSVVINNSTFIRYFYLSDAFRDSSGNLTSTSLYYDPSTKLVTVSVRPSGVATSSAVTFSFYITRNSSDLFNQTSWAGGGGQSSAVTFVSNFYSNSTSTTISASGSIQLTAAVGNSCVY